MFLRTLIRYLFPLVGLFLAVVWWYSRRPAVEYPEAYIANRTATLWSTTAEVRRPVATLRYGMPVVVLRRLDDQAEVQTADGARGWINTDLLMDEDVWQHSSELLAQARRLPVQALGHTRVVSNVRAEPGRDGARIYQFRSRVPVEVLDRRVVRAPAEAGNSASRDEAWLFVMRSERGANAESESGTQAAGYTAEAATSEPAIPMAGWLLAQFIELDPPAPLPVYANSARMRIVAWAVLNFVTDAGEEKPQYVVVGTRGADSDLCDFAMLRVYTWGAQRQRYETAFIDNELCGAMPLQVQEAPRGAEFSFPEAGDATVERVYRLTDTIVRRLP